MDNLTLTHSRGSHHVMGEKRPSEHYMSINPLNNSRHHPLSSIVNQTLSMSFLTKEPRSPHLGALSPSAHLRQHKGDSKP